MKSFLLALTVFFLVGTHAYGQSTITSPKLRVSTTVSKQTLASGQTAEVSVRFRGDTKSQTEAVPAAIVLVLDRSGSMVNDIDELKAASNKVVDLLDSDRDKVGIVAFSNSGVTLLGLSNDFQLAKNAISGINAGGLTNTADGIRKTLAELTGSNAPLEFAILFTDGIPHPNGTLQRQQIVELLKSADANGTVIHTVGLGQVDEILLKYIADRTGGVFARADNSSDLEKIFESLYVEQSKKLSTKSVEISESISSSLRVIDQTFIPTYFPPSVDQMQFDAWMQGAVQGFYNSNLLTFPTISELGRSNNFGYSFEIGVRKCSGVDQSVNLRTVAGEVSYRNGKPTPQRLVLQVNNNVNIIVLKCGVYVEKEWSEFNRMLSIRVINSHSDSIRGIDITDYLSPNFLPDLTRLEEFVPSPSQLSGNRVNWIVDEIPSQTSLEFHFPVLEVSGVQSGVVDIQSDGAVTWTHQYPQFRFNDSDVGYQELKSDLENSSQLSQLARNLLSRKIGSTVIIPSATIAADSTGSVSNDGFLYEITLPVSEISKVPKPVAFDPTYFHFSGRVLFKKIDSAPDGTFEVYLEYRNSKAVPYKSTTADFVPQ